MSFRYCKYDTPPVPLLIEGEPTKTIIHNHLRPYFILFSYNYKQDNSTPSAALPPPQEGIYEWKRFFSNFTHNFISIFILQILKSYES